MTFTGKWKTRNGSIVRMDGQYATVIESEEMPFTIGHAFTIGEDGSCYGMPCLDLMERIKLESGIGYTE